MISEAHKLVMNKIASAVRSLLPEIQYQGICDLTLDNRKFSGNSLRCKRSHLLYHGTILYDFPLELISTCLKQPPRQPEYREKRTHQEFLTNLPVTALQLREALTTSWSPDGPLSTWPRALCAELVQSRYRQDAWNLRL
jgi:lipoate-protein ligase A